MGDAAAVRPAGARSAAFTACTDQHMTGVAMAYDEGLAHRIRELTEEQSDVTEKKMFGGLCFLVGGNMACGIVGDELMLRVGADAYDDCLAQPHAREMDFTGRAMKGMIYVATDGFAEDEDLAAWLERGLGFARSLPAKGTTRAGKKSAVRNRAAKKKSAKKKSAKKKASRAATRRR